jgi:hypothetical protein
LDHYEIKLDDGKWTNVAQICEYALESLSDGLHIVQVKAVDITKNVMITQTSFTIDATLPTIKAFSPFGTDIELKSDIIISFSEQMDKGSVVINVENITGAITWNEDITEMTLEPSTDFDYETEYKIEVFGKDIIGNHLEPFSWTFTTIELPKITGRIVDENSNPVSSVNITLGSSSEKTNSAGYFTIKTLPGNYEIIIDKTGYLPLKQDVVVTHGKTKNLGVIQITHEQQPDNKNDDNNDKASSEFPWVVIVIIVIIVVLIILGLVIKKIRS